MKLLPPNAAAKLFTPRGGGALLLIALLIALAPRAQAQTPLDTLRTQALRHSRTLEEKRLDIRRAEADRHDARMNFLPRVSASAMGFLSASDLIDGRMKVSDSYKQSLGASSLVKNVLEAQPQELAMAFSQLREINFSALDKGAVASLMIMEPLFAGGQIVNGNRLARVGEDVAHLNYQIAERDLLQSVDRYFWAIQALRGNLASLDAVDRQLEALHREVADYVKAGLTNRSDLLKVELTQQEMASNRMKLTNGLALTEMALAQIVGADIETFHAATFLPADILPPEAYLRDHQAAVLTRPELRLTERATEAKRLQVKMERGKNLPQLTIGAVGMYNYMQGDIASHTNLDPRDQTLGRLQMNNLNLMGVATLSVPISDWWARRGALHKAKAEHLQARLTEQDTREKLLIDNIDTWNRLTEAYQQTRLAAKQEETASENLRLARDYYKVGQQTMSDLLDAVTSHQRARALISETTADYLTAVADYQRKVASAEF